MEKIPDFRNGAVLSICLTEHSKTALCPCIRSLQQKDILIPHRLQCCNRVREKKLSTKLHLCSCSLSFDFCFVFFLGRRTFFSDLGVIFPLKFWKDLGAPKLAIPGLSCKLCKKACNYFANFLIYYNLIDTVETTQTLKLSEKEQQQQTISLYSILNCLISVFPRMRISHDCAS